jgi:DNA-binding NarL/FixJ family response regulator
LSLTVADAEFSLWGNKALEPFHLKAKGRRAFRLWILPVSVWKGAVSNAPIKVFIATRNRLLGDALCRLFQNEKDVRVVGHAGYWPDITQQISRVCPDVFLLNPVSPVLTDFECLQEAHQRFPQFKIVLFGMGEDENVFFEAVRQGTTGYVLQDADAAAVVAAVRAVMRGEAVCPPRLCLALFSHVARQRPVLMPPLRMQVELGLTRRERELVPMIAQGLTNKEIASLLNVSEQTVKNEIHRMMRKAGASKRLDILEICRLPKWLQ